MAQKFSFGIPFAWEDKIKALVLAGFPTTKDLTFFAAF